MDVPVYVHPPLYRALKPTFPSDIGGLSRDGTSKSEMGQGLMGQTPAMFNAKRQP